MRIEKSLKTFFALILALIVSLSTIGYVWSKFVVEDIDKQVCISYSDETEELTRNTFKGLEQLVEDFANDPNIIKAIEGPGNYSTKESEIKKSIKYAQGLLTATSFVESIEVSDSDEKELYSSNGYYAEFDIKSRPWYEKAYEEYLNGRNVITTSIHEDKYNKRETISIISFVKNDKKEIIGCVMLNAYMDKFTEYMENYYGKSGVVRIYVELPEGTYYNHKKGVRSIEEIESGDKRFIVRKNNLLFSFNKNRTLIHIAMRDASKVNFIIFIIFILFTILGFIIIKRKALNPLIENISKLKKILKQLNEYDEDEFHGKDGLKQLDFIVGAFDSAINEKAKEYIYYDQLTKLPNRKGLEEYFAKISKDEKFALIFIDLNKFKNINDVYGHLVGDRFLQEFSDELKEVVGERGILSRVSGDEFVILYRNFTINNELQEFYEKNIINLFKNEKLLKYKLEVSFSAGVAVYPKDGEDLRALIKKSDYMMYVNKKKGIFYNLGFFDYEVYKEIERKDIISIELKKAVEKEELFMLYQPILNKDREVKHVEALIRWNNKELGFVSPMEFITLAEKNRSIIKIGYWVFDRVCSDMRKVLSENEDLIININVSSIQLLKNDFVPNVKEIIEKNGLQCRNICVEITESVILEEEETSIKNLNLLKKLGFKLSLDDFGTGYTSFSYLKKFKGGSLKIDKSILDDATIRNEYGIINSIKDIGHELDFEVVVEGVETLEQFNSLVNINCDLFQGYYFSKPIKKEEFEEFIK